MNGAFFITFVWLMKHSIYILFLSSFFLFNELGFASRADTLTTINNSYDSLLNSGETHLDFLFYKHENDIPINNLGPFGSAYYFATSSYLYKNSLFKKEDVLIRELLELQGIKPYTNIQYVNASRKEQLFKIKHYQQFGKQLSLDFNLDKVSSPGLYINQEANNTLFNGKISYVSKKNNYDLAFGNEIQRDFYEENGGMSSLDNFENKVFDNERTYGVNLFTSNSFLKRYSFHIKQRLDLYKLGSDSIKDSRIYVRHKFIYESQQRVFFDNDPQSNIYQTILIDSTATIDSVYFNNYNNRVAIGLRKSKVEIELFGQNEIINYFQSFGIDTNYFDNYIGVYGENKGENLQIKGLIKYGLTGYRVSDLLSDFDLKWNRNKYLLDLGIGYTNREPDINYVNYTSNHYEWRNYDFKKENIVRFNGEIKLKKMDLDLTVNTKLVNNALYFDSLSNASQYNKLISFSTFSAGKNYSFSRFYFRTAVSYQITSNDVIVPLPEVVFRQIAYYQGYAFKKVLKFQFGVGFSFMTDYYGYNYSPALSEFYIQQNKQLGNYPNIDLFLNTHLKRAQIFIKYEHINSGRSLSKSYLVTGYPQMNKSLKFGVSWNMFD